MFPSTEDPRSDFCFLAYMSDTEIMLKVDKLSGRDDIQKDIRA